MQKHISKTSFNAQVGKFMQVVKLKYEPNENQSTEESVYV